MVAGQLRLRNDQSLDHETEPVVEVTVTSTDAAGAQVGKLFRLQVTNAVENPNDIAMSNLAIAENSADGTAVGALSVSDPDLLETFTYALTDDAGGLFTVDANGVVRVAAGANLNHESQDQYSITAEATDSNGNSTSRTFVISVTDVNEAPTVDAGLNSQVVNEDDFGRARDR